MPDATPLTFPFNAALVVAKKAVLCATDGVHPWYVYNSATETWLVITGAYSPRLCTDGVCIWWLGVTGVIFFQAPLSSHIYQPQLGIQDIASLDQIVYIVLSDGSLHSMTGYEVCETTPQSISNAPTGNLVTNNTSLYVCNSQSLSEYLGSDNWRQCIAAPSNVTFDTDNVLASGSQVMAIGSDGNIYVYDSAAGESLGQIPACPNATMYAFCPLYLVACTDAGNVFL